eukprot:TRINITY_DN21402_c0_g1_i1.p2 TRINITY_DN21402_c0_g1~~TRINITY_DN21402_c0_g1_i1.p2  ORF type:complete len:132 (+),score=27.05 TRINITY_DN21402_c0_g1_i1:71-466(+)
MIYIVFFFFFKQKTAYEIMPSLVGSEMCIRDRVSTQSTWDNSEISISKPCYITQQHGNDQWQPQPCKELFPLIHNKIRFTTLFRRLGQEHNACPYFHEVINDLLCLGSFLRKVFYMIGMNICNYSKFLIPC